MTLEIAILNTLEASPRAIPAEVILGFIPSFTGGSATLSDLNQALKRMERAGDVIGTAHRDKGIVWKETAEGRLRLAAL